MEKENPDYEDIDSEFSNKCIVMQQQSSEDIQIVNYHIQK